MKISNEKVVDPDFTTLRCRVVPGAMIRLGCIADDFTGGTDLANELVKGGMRTALVVGVSDVPLPTELDAIVVALRSRTARPEQAVQDSLAALDQLIAAGASHIYFKYCSTFDSTTEGNIGPVLAALAGRLGEPCPIVCPAFPANGRTIYNGYLFVGRQLLHESSMRDHPLTPMRDSCLMRLLSAQMNADIGLLPLKIIDSGDIGECCRMAAATGKKAIVADALTDGQLERLARACAVMSLSSGASGLGAGLARALATNLDASPASLPRLRGRQVILAGSCSQATQRQVATMRAAFPSFALPLDTEKLDELIAATCDWIDRQTSDAPLLIFSSAGSEAVDATRRRWGSNVSKIIEEAFSHVAAYLVHKGADRLIVAGGETSGSVTSGLGIHQLLVGPEIEPGVPWTIAPQNGITQRPLLLALKSGNFGSDDFFLKAFKVAA